MEKFKEIIDQLKEKVKTLLDNSLLDYIDFLNGEYNKMDNPEKTKFIEWIKIHYKSFENECVIIADDVECIDDEILESCTPMMFLDVIKYFLVKERFEHKWAKQWLAKSKAKIEKDIRESKNAEISLIQQEATLYPNTQKKVFFRQKHENYLLKLKSSIDFEKQERRKFYWFGNPFNPLDENQSLRSMVVAQKHYNRKLGYFWLPMPNADVFERENELYSTIDNIMEYSFQPALELYCIIQWINTQLEPKKSKLFIIKKEFLAIIFYRFKEYFKNETLESWTERFIYPAVEKINKIDVTEKAIEGSSKLVLLALLDAIQQKKQGSFIYQDFVKERFGIKAYDRAKNEHKEKRTYQEMFKICSKILENEIV